MKWRRETTSAFDFHYFRFFNPSEPKKTISSGTNRNAAGTLSMTPMENYSSSENWILYFQSGTYFIRNYDYGGGLQLGLEAASDTAPRLLARSGKLGQQWTLNKADDGKSWTLMNGLLGKDSYLGLDGLRPVMTKDKSKSTAWSIEVNESAGMPAAGSDMIQGVQDFETSSRTVTSSISTSSPAPTTTSTITGPPNPPHNSLSAGAIAGIVIGALAVTALLAGLTLFLLARKKKAKKAAEAESASNPYQGQPAQGLNHADQLHEAPAYNAHNAHPSEKYAYVVDEGPQELSGASPGNECAELDAHVPSNK